MKKLLLQHPELFQDIKPLLKGMSLGVISTFFSENRQTSDQQGENDSDVVDYKYENWFLCEESESRLETSISERACVLVNGKLLVKFVGRISALCLESFSVGGSTFVAGHWYCPVSDWTVDSLKQSFAVGEFRFKGSVGRWAYMRPMYNYRKDPDSQELDILLKDAQTFASKNKAVMPELNMEARKAYRHNKLEELSLARRE
ncbi:MAG: hypothetical protein H6773_02175 [Pseudomonadales bacterium]|nr:hypothetical protein [Pseudomonadales bacterium]